MDKITLTLQNTGIRRFAAALSLACLLTVACRSALAQSAPAAAQGVGLTITTSGPAWIAVRVDGGPPVQRTMRPGETWTVRGRKVIVFTTGNAGAVRLRWNGRLLSPLGKHGKRFWRRFAAPPVAVAPQPAPQPAPAPVPPVVPAPQPPPAPEVQPFPSPGTETVPVQPGPAQAGRGVPEGLLDYAAMAVLVVLLIVSIWMLVMVLRENKLLSVLSGVAAGPEKSIRLLTSHKLSRGKTAYLLEVGDRIFLVATGDVRLLAEIPEGGGGRRGGSGKTTDEHR